MRAEAASSRPTARSLKFRQAAFVYLHVGLLYEFTIFALAREGMLEAREPIWPWLALGALILAAVFAVLWWWQNAWAARVIWALHALRLPALIGHAFLPAADASLPPSFYIFAIVIVLINLGFLARAAWDL